MSVSDAVREKPRWNVLLQCKTRGAHKENVFFSAFYLYKEYIMSQDNLHNQRHSLAHILAHAVQDIYDDVKFGVGPVIDNGFYYDFDLEQSISEEDLEKIESRMKEIIDQDLGFERQDLSIEEALEKVRAVAQPYKEELISDLAQKGSTSPEASEIGEQGAETVSFYKVGEFDDLCRGGHVEKTRQIGAFKLMRVSGAYWRGKEANPQMQRIYGIAFETPKELRQHLDMLEEAKKRDHRKLGKELDLFFFHETAPGMPYWLPNGTILYNELINFWREEHYARDYKEIVSPLINKKELYQTSGHFDHYWEEMFTTEETEEGELYGLKAMNCPNAMVVFGSRQRSYRELPLRLGDTDNLHRFERSGTLNGLLRVRGFRQDDAHIYVTEDQIKDEYSNVFEITDHFYSIFGMEYSFRLGTRPEKFMGDPSLWDKAEGVLKEILESSGKDFFIEEGDGAFYGPKIDILMKDVLGRPWQMGTIQLDFQQPLRFNLTYTDKDGTEKTPIVIHRVIYGSMERFIGILIEHLGGRFPIWLAPEQVRIITVNQEMTTTDFARDIATIAREYGVRVHVDNDNESVGKKIRNAELMKVPYTLVIGEKEIESGRLSPRIRKDLVVIPAHPELAVEDFFKTVANETKMRVQKSSI